MPNQPHHSPGHQHKMASQSQASVQFVVFRDHLTAYNSVSRDGFVSSHTVRYHRISLMRGLARAYIATADCAPYHENCTRMAELTTMLSWTINACEIDRQSRWDVAGHHPNITPVSRTPYKALEYVSKDCDITHDCFDESNRPRRDSGRPKGNGKRKWSEIISAPDENSFLESLKENDPRALVVCHGNVRQYIGWRYPAERRHYESPTGLSIRIDIDERIKAFSSRIGQRGRH